MKYLSRIRFLRAIRINMFILLPLAVGFFLKSEMLTTKNVKTFFFLYKYALSAFLVCLVLTSVSGYIALRTPREERVQQETKPHVSIGGHQALFFANEVQKEGETTEQTVQHDKKIEEGKTFSGKPRLFLGPAGDIPQSQREGLSNNANRLHVIVVTLRTPTNDLLMTVPEGNSVYEMMKVASDTQKFRFTAKDFGKELGVFVQEIDGIKENPRGNKYWIYYINGKKASAGVSSVFLKQNDMVEWRYEGGDE